MAALAALLAAGCGATGGDEAASSVSTPSTEAPSGTGPDSGNGAGGGASTTTTAAEPADEPGTGPGGGDPGDADLRVLEAAFPDARDIGPDFALVDEDEEEEEEEGDGAEDDALEQACPDAELFFSPNDDDEEGDELERTYEDGSSRQVQITLERSRNESLDADELALVADLFNACGEVEYEEDGNTVRLSIRAEAVSEPVDHALRLHLDMELTSPFLPRPLDMRVRGLLFVVDGVTATVMMMDGIDETTFDPVPAEFERLEGIAGLVEERLAAVAGD